MYFYSVNVVYMIVDSPIYSQSNWLKNTVGTVNEF